MENMFWIEEQFLLVDKLFGEGEFAQGKRLLEEILEQEPGFGRAHNHLGWLYYAKLDDYEKAAYHLKLAIKFSPGYPAGFLNYTYLLNYLNRHADLLVHAKEALKVEGVSKSVIYLEMGKSYEVNGFYKEAVKAYTEAKRYSLSNAELTQIEEGLERVNTKVARFSKKFFSF